MDPNVYVVSNGAEVIIISAPFYRDNMNEKCSAVLTLKLESILKHDYVNEMRIKNNWDVFKHQAVVSLSKNLSLRQ